MKDLLVQISFKNISKSTGLLPIKNDTIRVNEEYIASSSLPARQQFLIIDRNHRMGQRTSETLKNDSIELDNWIEAVEDPAHSLFVGVNPYRKRLLVNKITNELIEEYELQFLNQEDFSCYSKDVQLRKEEDNKLKIQVLSNEEVDPYRACPYIYKVKYFTNTSVDELCTTIYNGLLYISKVQLRLKEINDIPLNDQLYLYQCCLEGFKVLYEQVGYFDITEEMIFFTQEGKVKVWMNPNLSKHHPNYEAGANANINSIQIQGSQSEMLKSLINLIEDNTDLMAGDRPVHFRQYLRNKGIIDRLSFYKAIDEFHTYVEENGLEINNHMKSIYELFHHDDEHHGNLYKSQSQSHKSQVDRVKVHKDYESMKNSSHELSFQKLNNSNYDRLVPSKFNQTNPLEMSRASKNSYNSQYNTRNIDSYSRLPKLKSPNIPRHSQGPSDTGITYGSNEAAVPRHNIPNQPSHLTVFSKPVIKPDINRGIIFGPPQRKNFQLQSLITKYRSLQKAPVFVSNQNRPITFSYQNQQPILINGTPNRQPPQNNENEQSKKQRKQSIIDKLNSPIVLQTINTIKTQKSTPTSEPFTRSLKSSIPNDSRSSKNVNYFSTTQAFMLDSEIAEDMMKYLGFNPNLI